MLDSKNDVKKKITEKEEKSKAKKKKNQTSMVAVTIFNKKYKNQK